MPSEPLTDAEREVADDQAWQSGYAAGRAAASHSYRTALGLARTPDTEGLLEALEAMTKESERPASRGRIVEHELDSIHAVGEDCALCRFLAAAPTPPEPMDECGHREDEHYWMCSVCGHVPPYDALTPDPAAPTQAPLFWTHYPHCNDRCVHYLEGEPDKTASGSRPEPSHGAPSDVSAPGRPPAPDGAPTTPAPEDGAANFDDAVQRAFAGTGVEVRTSFTPSAPECHPDVGARVRRAAENILDRHYADPDDDAAILARAAIRQAPESPIDVERLWYAILAELAELWGEPSDAVSTQVRPIVARSIATRYAALSGERP